MPREPKHASNRQAEEIIDDDLPLSKRQAAIDGITPSRNELKKQMQDLQQAKINLATTDLDGTFERLQAGEAEVVQEPTDQPYGVRDCAFRDPAGNLVRIQELR